MKSLSGPATGLIVCLIAGAILISAGQFASRSMVFAEGSLVLSDELIDKARGIRTVFIVLYDDENPTPMPYAAIREAINEDARKSFLNFVLTKDNMQIMNPAGEGFPKKLRIKARLDRSGAAGTDQPGDITGELKGVGNGARGLRIVLNQFITG